ncbi:MAG: CPBP family glutamic-type intramembrane protease [Dehalococcoidia bacterium]|nr:CPBP family glutamic-type intramembrane protease [Dehalococcoidia bacterium]
MVTALQPGSNTSGSPIVHGGKVILGVVVVLAICVTGLAVGGPFGQFVEPGLEVLPFTVLAVMAYLGIDRRWGRVIAWIVMLGLILGFALSSFALSAMALMNPDTGSIALTVNAAVKLGLILVGMGLAAIVGAIGFLPRARRALSRVLPLDPRSFVHMVALVVVVTLTLVCLVPLIVLGQPVMLSIVDGPNSSNLLGNLDSSAMLRQQAYALIWTVICSVFAVGYLVRRTLRQGLARLGLVRPTWRQVIGGLGLAVVLVIAATGIEGAIGLVWATMGWTRTDSSLVSKLFESYTSPVGAIVLGISAGLGEELSVRGVLQPRLGLLLSNLFFVSLHAFQYSWDALLVVLFVGLVLGITRRRTNTTTSAIAHGTYDFLLIMAVIMHGPGSF